MNLEQSIEHYARTTPDKAAVISQGQTLSYAELWERIRQRAQQLREEGLSECQPYPFVTTQDADFIVTGEGSADRQTLMGKLPMGILAQSAGVPVCLIAGRINDREELLHAGFARVACINPVGISLEEAMRKDVAMQNIADTVNQIGASVW